MPYEIETKDGIVIQGIPDNIPPDHPSVVEKVKAARNSAAASGVNQDWIGSAVQSVTEPVAALGSGALATPVAGLAGIAQGAANLVGLGTTPVGDRVRQVQEALTYQPQSAGGKAVTSAISYPFEKLAQGADVVGQAASEATGSPAVGAGVNAAIQTAVPYGLFKGAQALKGTARPVDPNVAAARDVGIRVTPSEGSGGPISTTLESLSGEPRLAKKISVKNQPVVNDLIAKDVGVAPGTELSRDLFYDNIKKEGKAYEVVRRAGRITADDIYKKDLAQIVSDYKIAETDFPGDKSPIVSLVENADVPSFDASSAVSKIKTLRMVAKTAFDNRHSELGRAAISVADALEEQIGRHLSEAAKTRPDLASALPDFQNARTNIAKNYQAIKAINDATGDINPQSYARLLDKGRPLSGEAQTVAEMAQAFPRSLQRTNTIKSTGPTIFDLGTAWVGHHAPLLFARPIARSILSSQPYQALMARPGMLQDLSQAQANPGVLGAEIAAEQQGPLEQLRRSQPQQ